MKIRPSVIVGSATIIATVLLSANIKTALAAADRPDPPAPATVSGTLQATTPAKSAEEKEPTVAVRTKMVMGTVDAALDAVVPGWKKKNPLSADEVRKMIETLAAREAEDPVDADLGSYAQGRRIWFRLTRPLANWGRSTPDEASAWADKLPDGRTRDHALVELAVVWTDKNLDKSIAVVGKLTHPDKINALCSRLSPHLARIGAEKAQEGHEKLTEWLGTFPEQNRDQVAVRITSMLAQDHAKQALELVEALPAGPGRALAFDAVAREWGNQDHSAAAEWLEGLPNGAEKRAAVKAFVGAVGTREPGLGAKWLAEMGEGTPLLKRHYAERIARVWLRKDPEKARAWIMESPDIPKAHKARLLHRGQR